MLDEVDAKLRTDGQRVAMNELPGEMTLKEKQTVVDDQRKGYGGLDHILIMLIGSPLCSSVKQQTPRNTSVRFRLFQLNKVNIINKPHAKGRTMLGPI